MKPGEGELELGKMGKIPQTRQRRGEEAGTEAERDRKSPRRAKRDEGAVVGDGGRRGKVFCVEFIVADALC